MTAPTGSYRIGGIALNGGSWIGKMPKARGFVLLRLLQLEHFGFAKIIQQMFLDWKLFFCQRLCVSEIDPTQ